MTHLFFFIHVILHRAYHLQNVLELVTLTYLDGLPIHRSVLFLLL